MRAVAERFVLGLTAPAERKVLGRSSAVQRFTFKFDSAADVIAGVMRYVDLLFALLALVAFAVTDESEST